MKSKFLNALSEEGSIHEANLSTESLDQSYGHLQAQIRDSHARQEKLLSNIQVWVKVFCCKMFIYLLIIFLGGEHRIL